MKGVLFLALMVGSQIWPIAHAGSSPDDLARGPFGSGEIRTGVEGGLAVSWIDDELYYNFRLRPELALGRVGVGFNLDLLVSADDGEIREIDLKPQKVFRYVRYGNPRDPHYGRIGALENSTLGHGILVHRYHNQMVENRRKVGMEIGVRRDRWSLELLTNNFQRGDLFGGRVAVAPLAERVDLPLLGRLQMGATYVREADEDQRKSNGSQEVDGVALDLELPLWERTSSRLWTYVDWARLLDHGSGRAVGLGAETRGVLDFLHLTVLLERRWSGEHFIPRYFDYLYELERYDEETDTRKSDFLDDLGSRAETVGELWLSLADLVLVRGLYEYPDVRPRNGHLLVEGRLPSLRGFSLSADYERKGINTSGDLFRLDEKSLLTAYAGYPLNQWTQLGVEYQWMFHRDSDGTLRTMKKVTPGVYFYLKL